MSDRRTDAIGRFRVSGIGTIAAGLVLVPLSVLASPVAAGLVLLVAAVAVWRLGSTARATSVAVGVGAVGGIVLVEAAPGVGLGLEPLAIAGLAVAFGVFDVLAGLLMRRVGPSGGS